MRRPLTVVALVAVPLLAGCGDGALAAGADAATARTALDDLAGALEARFTNVVRAPRFAYARLRLARYAFAPSRLVNDTAIWTSARTTRAGAVRDLELHSELVGNRFVFTPARGTPLPARAGEQRHHIALEQLAEDDWRWSTEVDHAVGSLPPDRAAAVLTALLASAERPAGLVRRDYRAAFPRTAEAFGRLVVVDSIGTAAAGDGSTLVTLRLRLDGAAVGHAFPALGKYVREFLEPAHYAVRLSGAGADWFDLQAADRLITLRFRSRRGALQPLAGTPRPMPDTLTMLVDARARFGLFTVGFSDLRGEFAFVAAPGERGWQMRFTQEPAWHLPLVSERLLHTPLRRPFEGTGVHFRLGLRTAANGQTLLNRVLEAPVRESAIMRFLGALGFTAVSEYAGAVEEEENRFLAEGLRAMRADLAALR